MTKVTKKDLAELVASKVDCTKKDANEVVNAIFDEIAKNIKKNNTVDISGFGKFVLKTRKARTGINPATGEKIKIKAAKAPGFRAAKALKELVK